jgi:hypothetical protein
MERIEFWRKELQGAPLYDGRTRDSLSRIKNMRQDDFCKERDDKVRFCFEPTFYYFCHNAQSFLRVSHTLLLLNLLNLNALHQRLEYTL